MAHQQKSMLNIQNAIGPIWLHGELIAVTGYRKGAMRVAELLQKLASSN